MVGDGRHVYSVYSYIEIDFLSFLDPEEYEEDPRGMLRLNFGGHLSFFNVLSPIGNKNTCYFADK